MSAIDTGMYTLVKLEPNLHVRYESDCQWLAHTTVISDLISVHDIGCENPSFAALTQHTIIISSTFAAQSYTILWPLQYFGFYVDGPWSCSIICTLVPADLGALGLQHVRSTWHRTQHFRSTRSPPGNLYASGSVGVVWRTIPYNIYRIVKLLALYNRTGPKNARFAARSQHASPERSTFAAPNVVPVKIHGLEINN